jgi:hypothetical protein
LRHELWEITLWRLRRRPVIWRILLLVDWATIDVTIGRVIGRRRKSPEMWQVLTCLATVAVALREVVYGAGRVDMTWTGLGVGVTWRDVGVGVARDKVVVVTVGMI